MNKYYSKFTKKNTNSFGRQHYYRKNNYYKKNQYNNNYNQNYKRKIISYDIYEEEIPYDKETILSTNAPSTKDGSFSLSSNSNSRRQSFSDANTNENTDNKNQEIMQDSTFIFMDNKSNTNHGDILPKINLSENELKTAYYKPKNYKEATTTKNENIKKDEDENIVILEINVKISKDKSVDLKLKKYDDMFEVVRECCKKNEISDNYANYFIYTIIKALNSIYGINNLKLNNEEIKVIQDLKKKCDDN